MTRYTHDLKQQIEHILHWEPSSHWQLHDFAQLSHRLQARTGQLIEASELQVFWQSTTVPSPVVLNALAQFADYVDWHDFLDRNSFGYVELDDEVALTHPPAWEIPGRWVVILCWLSIVGSVLVSVLLLWKR